METPSFDLNRFITAQERDFEMALSEIKAGQKRSHWMWYIFPQISGLGSSYYAQYFAIPNLEAARAYMEHPYLRNNLITITNALLELDETNPSKIMGFPDDMKLRSCMTLFELAAPNEMVFGYVLDKFYGSSRDQKTLEFLNL